MNKSADLFSDPRTVAHYANGPARMVPGFADLQRMALLLLSERAPQDARVLVLGAGGGLELRTFAQARPHWSFDGIDPSAPMLELAERTLGALAAQVRLHQGYIDAAPAGPFDAGCCLLTLHFVARAERLRTALEVHRRLRPGAPFVAAHLSIPDGEEVRARWLSRYVAFAVNSGVEPEQAERGRAALQDRLEILTPEQDEALLRAAGFSSVELFYVGFSFRGWVAHA